jgi:hypothetical protein
MPRKRNDDETESHEVEGREGETPEQKPWEAYANDAIRQLYPNLRDGVDYQWSRPPDDPTGTPRMLAWSEKLQPADMAEIQRISEQIRDADPYGPGGSAYAPGETLHSPRTNDPGMPEKDKKAY